MESAHSGPIVRRTAVALFRRWFGDESRWLVCLDERQWRPELIEAECLENDKFREALDREIAWRLRLDRGKDYIISQVPRIHRELVSRHVRRSGEQENVLEVIEFFIVEPFGTQVFDSLDGNLAVQWWTVGEMLGERGSEEWRLPQRQRDLLKVSDVFSGCRP